MCFFELVSWYVVLNWCFCCGFVVFDDVWLFCSAVPGLEVCFLFDLHIHGILGLVDRCFCGRTARSPL